MSTASSPSSPNVSMSASSINNASINNASYNTTAGPHTSSPLGYSTLGTPGTPLERLMSKISATPQPFSPYSPAQSILSNNDNPSSNVQSGTLRHALNVVERLQSQVNELARENTSLSAENQTLTSDLSTTKTSLKNTRTKLSESENTLASLEGTSTSKRREWKLEGEKLRDDLSMLHRKLLTTAEVTRGLKDTIGRMEKEYHIKIEKSEESVSRAMELVDRVQVAAGKAVQKERDVGRDRRREEEEEIERATMTVKKFKKACEKLTNQNKSYSQKIHTLQSDASSQTREISTLRRSNDGTRDELSECKIQLARYEERSKDVVGFNREIIELKKSGDDKDKKNLELTMENDALKTEIESILDQYSINIAKVRSVAAEQIELEHSMRQRLQLEVKEAKGAIRDMSKEVKDRNALLNVLEDRLTNMNAIEVGMESTLKRAVEFGDDENEVLNEITQHQAQSRRKGEGLYNNDIFKKLEEIGLNEGAIAVRKAVRERTVGEGGEVKTNGGRAWTIN
ncbi:hypothetical protein TrLO_g8387 [Triparma laevis f. longispina]|uniref:Uncharacterized protein n=1 Tax=Triparma laevis f. longispina TaxID=1714387 RepID=A0A9W7C435_9STRA|nr:hypothetical protein TrLO_g8387 [Triparma laevis f. longispina]